MTSAPTRPIKIVTPDKKHFVKPRGGGEVKVFGPVTSKVRSRLVDEVAQVETEFAQSFSEGLPGVLKLRLKPEALAKSHRPTELLEKAKCDVIGLGDLGELLIGVDAHVATRLRQQLQELKTQRGVANISTIQSFEKFELAAERVDTVVAAVGEAPDALKVRLFRHSSESNNLTLRRSFLELLKRMQLRYEKLRYGHLNVFSVSGASADDVKQIAAFVGTQSLGKFPRYQLVRPESIRLRDAQVSDLPPPDPNKVYPVVAMIDSGVDPRARLIQPWIQATEKYVAKGDADYAHGTFVAGLLAAAKQLNSGAEFPDAQCKVLDVQAVPAGGISEDELVETLWDVIPKHPTIKVWNMSLGGKVTCTDHGFSDLAIVLDELQETYDIVFVLPSGNVLPPRAHEKETDGTDRDRVCSPGDSVRALTIGALAHLEKETTCAKSFEASPFSRRGPGPVFIVKPDLSHFGGNCDVNGKFDQVGVLSLSGDGGIAEDVGTSFATPLVAAMLADLLVRPSPQLSPLLARTLLVHSAVLRSELTADEIRYRGFGIPQQPQDILQNQPWEITLVFELTIDSSRNLVIPAVPVPNCLTRSGKVFGAFSATLAYEPILDSACGIEYCRTNIDFSLGALQEGGEYKRRLLPYPQQSGSGRMEKELIKTGYKWAPLKVYRRISTRGLKGTDWRLTISATDRSGLAPSSVNVALAVTFADPERQQPVYNEVVAEMNQIGWQTKDVRVGPIRSRVR